MRRVRFVISFFAAIVLSADILACTTVIVSAGASATGRPLLWKQRDTGNPFNTLVHMPATDSTYAYTGLFNVDDLHHRNVYAGENEKGFAIVNNNSYNLAKGKYPTKNGDLMRRALESCESVDDFEKMLLAQNPRMVAANFGVIDSFGGAAYFEAADSSVTRFDVPWGGYLIRSNYSVSGSDAGAGYARYETASDLMAAHKGKYTPSFLIDGLGRSFRNSVLGYDASKRFAGTVTYDEDFIPRPTTTSSVCFDGDKCIWAAVGYTPASYVMPLEICSDLPSCLAEANALAERLKCRMHPLPRDAGTKYIDFRIAGPILKIVRRYDRRAAALSGDNDALDNLFTKFKKEFD